MNKYENGIIYKIIGGDEIYIGSTTFTKEERLKQHINNYKNWLNNETNYKSSYVLFDKYQIENCKIDIIEPFPCETREELERQEGFHQRQNVCVNIKIAGRTKKEYHQDNIEKFTQYQKDYNENLADLGKIYPRKRCVNSGVTQLRRP